MCPILRPGDLEGPAVEIAVIVQDGINRMYHKQEDIFYYLTVMNELDRTAVSYQIVLTKSDKPSVTELNAAIAAATTSARFASSGSIPAVSVSAIPCTISTASCPASP